ncbi:MAG: glycosyltransferase family 2 protein, partial [candidate division WOR-3 bacterium]
MTKDSGSVCAIVVTYNRKNLLIECLEALRRQTRPLDGIYVIDNASTDDTPAYLMEKGYIAEIPPSVLLEPYEREYLLGNYVNGGSIRFHYVRLPENTGGAGGFHEGMKRAYEKGYDWMWLMDDDAEAKEDALEKLLLAIKAHNSLAGGSRVVNEDGATIYHHRGVFSKDCSKTSLIIPITESNSNTQFVEFCSFVGFLVNREVVRRFGLPDKRFFIFHDDLEYSLRIKDSGKILYVKDSVIVHRVSYCYSHFKKIHFL